MRAALLADGVTLAEGQALARLEQLEPDSPSASAGVVAILEDGTRIAGTHLLLAVGRAPRLAGLDLVAGQVEAGPKGVRTRADLRSVSNRRVWAVGDIADPTGIGPRAFTHVAGQHAGILVRSMLFRLPGTRVDYAALPRVTYTDPEIAQVGLTEAEARAAGHDDLRIHRWPLSENDRAIAEGRPEGLVKLVVTAKGRPARRRHPGAAGGRDGGALWADDRPQAAALGAGRPRPALSDIVRGRQARSRRVLQPEIIVALHEAAYRLAQTAALSVHAAPAKDPTTDGKNPYRPHRPGHRQHQRHRSRHRPALRRGGCEGDAERLRQASRRSPAPGPGSAPPWAWPRRPIPRPTFRRPRACGR
ncbi:hypothetical protein [Dankookia sp. P2]|uniref:hypothetical protein n=1 Tax=Dankookia sp. P2 TaxID=3423955 RepID=UPI003D66FE2B